jgi:hypothetical protein
MLLSGGLIAGPLYVTLALTQAVLRDGFDITRHAVSLLALGTGGWIQVANFVITGLLVLACAAGLRAVTRGGTGGTWGPLLLGVYGIALIGSGLFPADAGFGFPPGTPPGPPAAIPARHAGLCPASGRPRNGARVHRCRLPGPWPMRATLDTQDRRHLPIMAR